ncbi:hypothetical protein MANY_45350 [Mycolicibacterium anyangense]|uniref:Uncharacterized protein n=1 Tax=Mycolicibacterium anyangense TaxID=1431246 RepID=A0A6N4WF95_9MYCO|nr:hypothetical protein [Mycolicibacterium anyangense]BBZ79198.1 hypothetical protein MANY_45350 [Mycolicibacterium anyangense]
MTTGSADKAAGDRELDTVAWQFLCSPFTGPEYWHHSLDRRLDAFLRRHGREDILNDGAAYAVVIERVMANIGRARQVGVLTPPQH